MKTFNDFSFSDQIRKAIQKQEFTEPTLVQEKSIPSILEGKDLIGQSATGSGKTLAFGIGCVEQSEPKKGLQALILTPTRELADQVKNSINKIAYGKKLRVLSIYGGVSIGQQIEDLPYAEIVVATPGRLLDHISRGSIDLSKVKVFVLDEADRMLDMGFINDVEEIIKHCPKQRQTLFFSATMASEIIKLTKRYMDDPIVVMATKLVDPKKLKQVYYDVPKSKKMSLLVTLIKAEKSKLVMVFCNTRRTTDYVVKNLKINKISAIAIHGGFTQNKRTKTLEMFNNGRVEVMVCTDVAARGLDIDNVSHVYNYEMPKDTKDYVHRVGRTARAGKDGIVINLISDLDYNNFSKLLTDYRDMNIEKLDLPKMEYIKMDNSRSYDNSDRIGPKREGRRGSSRFTGSPSRFSSGRQSGRFGNNSNNEGRNSRFSGNQRSTNRFNNTSGGFRGNRNHEESNSRQNSRFDQNDDQRSKSRFNGSSRRGNRQRSTSKFSRNSNKR